MHTYTEAFAWRDVTVAQVLLTRDDLSDRNEIRRSEVLVLDMRVGASTGTVQQTGDGGMPGV